MLIHTIRKKATLIFTYGDFERVVKIRVIGRRGYEYEWEISGANKRTPDEDYDLSFVLYLGDEEVIINARDHFRHIRLFMKMRDEVRVKIEK